MKRTILCISALALLLQVTSAAAATRYTFTRLGTVGGYPVSGSGSSYAYGINDLGHVAGTATSPGNGVTQAYIWNNGVMTGLGTLQGPASGTSRSYAYGINEADTVVGYSNSPTMTQAFRWQGGTMTGLGYLGPSASGVSYSYAYGVNDLSQVAGYSSFPTGSQAYVYADGLMTGLSELGPASYAYAINVNSDVAGFSNTVLYGPNQAFLRTSSGSVTWLGSLKLPTSGGSSISYAYGINDAAEVVGYSPSPQSNTEAFIWSSTQGMRALGDLPGGIYNSIAYDINNSEQVVGRSISSISGSYEAFVWDAVQGMVSLNTLVDGASGWVLREAKAINNNGQIVGYGENPAGGQEAFLLTPAAPSPTIAFSPASITFSAVAGGANPADQTLSISNSQTETLTWAVSTSAGWLTLNPLSGQQSGTVTLSVNTAGLAAGTYVTNVQITGNASNSPQSVPVNLTLSSLPPTIGFAPSSLSWTINEGSTTSTKQQLTITNTGGSAMFFTALGNQAWIGVQPVSGTINSGAFSYADVSVNPTGKTPGTYSGNVVITASGATNTPQNVPVAMTILPAITVTYPNGGETLRYGTNVTITWNVNAPGQTVSKTDTYYSTNSGAAWTLIKSQTGPAANCSWKVPRLSKASAACLVRVQFKNAAGAVIAQDQSNAAFTITK